MKFSIIIPAHNTADYIRKALDSVKSQKYTDYELIVVCDDCNDNTASIAKEYTDKVYEVNYHNDGQARNKGLDEASGRWVLFLDSDDWWLHEFVLDILNQRLRETTDIMIFGFLWKDKGYRISDRLSTFPNLWSRCFKRSFIGDTRAPNIYPHSDAEFNNILAAKKPNIMFLDMPLYYYNYLRANSITEAIRSRKDLYEI